MTGGRRGNPCVPGRSPEKCVRMARTRTHAKAASESKSILHKSTYINCDLFYAKAIEWFFDGGFNLLVRSQLGSRLYAHERRWS